MRPKTTTVAAWVFLGLLITTPSALAPAAGETTVRFSPSAVTPLQEKITELETKITDIEVALEDADIEAEISAEETE